MTDNRAKAPSAAQPRRAWQRMLSGRRLDLLDPSSDDVEISDIARGLARVARWNGQTTGAHTFSVAQHSLLVERLLPVQAQASASERTWRLAALLHDAPEYVIGDLISPFKAALGYDYKAFEYRLLAAIHRRFGLPEALPPQVATAIKAADTIAAYWEATELAGFTVAEARRYFGDVESGRAPAQPGGALADVLEPWPTAVAEQRFLDRFSALSQP